MIFSAFPELGPPIWAASRTRHCTSCKFHNNLQLWLSFSLEQSTYMFTKRYFSSHTFYFTPEWYSGFCRVDAELRVGPQRQRDVAHFPFRLWLQLPPHTAHKLGDRHQQHFTANYHCHCHYHWRHYCYERLLQHTQLANKSNAKMLQAYFCILKLSPFIGSLSEIVKSIDWLNWICWTGPSVNRGRVQGVDQTLLPPHLRHQIPHALHRYNDDDDDGDDGIIRQRIKD